jgi:mannose-6-phosphate isomerase-like protein (cupin superfamily)
MGVQLDVRQPILLGPGEGEAIVDKPHRELRILCDHEWLTVTWTRHTAGERGAEPHYHRQHADSFYVLAGEMTVRLGARLEPVTAGAGTLVVIPPGVVHSFDNDGSEELRFLNFHAPDGGFAQYLRTQEPFDSFDPPDDGGRPASDAIVTRPGGGERFQREDRVNTILADLPEISFFRLEVEPEWPGIGAHSHDNQVDTFFVLEGETGLVHGDDVVRAGAGSFYGAQPGARHGVVHDGGRAVLLNVHGPDVGFAEGIRRS